MGSAFSVNLWGSSLIVPEAPTRPGDLTFMSALFIYSPSSIKALISIFRKEAVLIHYKHTRY